MKVLSVRPCRRACCVSAAVSVSLSESMICSGATGACRAGSRGRHMRALFQPGQCLPPGRDRSSAILRRQPGKIIPIRRHPRQRRRIPVVRIERQQLPHQHRHRPAIHQDVMVGQHQPMLIGREPDQRKPQQRRRAEDRSARRDPAPGWRPAAARDPPSSSKDRSILRQGGSTRGTMICTGRLRLSCWKPARRLAWRSSRACAAACRAALSSSPCRREHQLHRIDVGRLRIIQRMEQQPLLQRRRAAGCPRSADTRLSSRSISPCVSASQRQIAGAAPAGAGLRRVAHQRRQRPEPALRKIANRFLREQRRRKSPGRRQRGAIGRIKRQRIDLERVSERHRRIAAAKPTASGSRSPVRCRRRRKPPQIVEPDLRHRKAAQAARPSPG